MIYTDAPTNTTLIMVSNIEQKCYTDAPYTNVLTYTNLSIVPIIEPMCYTSALDNIALTMVSSIEPKHYSGASSNQELIPPLFPLPETLLKFPFIVLQVLVLHFTRSCIQIPSYGLHSSSLFYSY